MIPFLGAWMLVLQLSTGQIVHLPSGTKEECEAALRMIAQRDDYVIRTDGGVMLPIRKALECLSPEDSARRQGNL
jgi:hypothetical protein